MPNNDDKAQLARTDRLALKTLVEANRAHLVKLTSGSDTYYGFAGPPAYLGELSDSLTRLGVTTVVEMDSQRNYVLRVRSSDTAAFDNVTLPPNTRESLPQLDFTSDILKVAKTLSTPTLDPTAHLRTLQYKLQSMPVKAGFTQSVAFTSDIYSTPQLAENSYTMNRGNRHLLSISMPGETPEALAFEISCTVEKLLAEKGIRGQVKYGMDRGTNTRYVEIDVSPDKYALGKQILRDAIDAPTRRIKGPTSVTLSHDRGAITIVENGAAVNVVYRDANTTSSSAFTIDLRPGDSITIGRGDSATNTDPNKMCVAGPGNLSRNAVVITRQADGTLAVSDMQAVKQPGMGFIVLPSESPLPRIPSAKDASQKPNGDTGNPLRDQPRPLTGITPPEQVPSTVSLQSMTSLQRLQYAQQNFTFTLLKPTRSAQAATGLQITLPPNDAVLIAESLKDIGVPHTVTPEGVEIPRTAIWAMQVALDWPLNDKGEPVRLVLRDIPKLNGNGKKTILYEASETVDVEVIRARVASRLAPPQQRQSVIIAPERTTTPQATYDPEQTYRVALDIMPEQVRLRYLSEYGLYDGIAKRISRMSPQQVELFKDTPHYRRFQATQALLHQLQGIDHANVSRITEIVSTLDTHPDTGRDRPLADIATPRSSATNAPDPARTYRAALDVMPDSLKTHYLVDYNVHIALATLYAQMTPNQLDSYKSTAQYKMFEATQSLLKQLQGVDHTNVSAVTEVVTNVNRQHVAANFATAHDVARAKLAPKAQDLVMTASEYQDFKTRILTGQGLDVTQMTRYLVTKDFRQELQRQFPGLAEGLPIDANNASKVTSRLNSRVLDLSRRYSDVDQGHSLGNDNVFRRMATNAKLAESARADSALWDRTFQLPDDGRNQKPVGDPERTQLPQKATTDTLPADKGKAVAPSKAGKAPTLGGTVGSAGNAALGLKGLVDLVRHGGEMTDGQRLEAGAGVAVVALDYSGKTGSALGGFVGGRILMPMSAYHSFQAAGDPDSSKFKSGFHVGHGALAAGAALRIVPGAGQVMLATDFVNDVVPFILDAGYGFSGSNVGAGQSVTDSLDIIITAQHRRDEMTKRANLHKGYTRGVIEFLEPKDTDYVALNRVLRELDDNGLLLRIAGCTRQDLMQLPADRIAEVLRDIQTKIREDHVNTDVGTRTGTYGLLPEEQGRLVTRIGAAVQETNGDTSKLGFHTLAYRRGQIAALDPDTRKALADIGPTLHKINEGLPLSPEETTRLNQTLVQRTNEQLLELLKAGDAKYTKALLTKNQRTADILRTLHMDEGLIRKLLITDEKQLEFLTHTFVVTDVSLIPDTRRKCLRPIEIAQANGTKAKAYGLNMQEAFGLLPPSVKGALADAILTDRVSRVSDRGECCIAVALPDTPDSLIVLPDGSHVTPRALLIAKVLEEQNGMALGKDVMVNGNTVYLAPAAAAIYLGQDTASKLQSGQSVEEVDGVATMQRLKQLAAIIKRRGPANCPEEFASFMEAIVDLGGDPNKKLQLFVDTVGDSPNVVGKYIYERQSGNNGNYVRREQWKARVDQWTQMAACSATGSVTDAVVQRQCWKKLDDILTASALHSSGTAYRSDAYMSIRIPSDPRKTWLGDAFSDTNMVNRAEAQQFAKTQFIRAQAALATQGWTLKPDNIDPSCPRQQSLDMTQPFPLVMEHPDLPGQQVLAWVKYRADAAGIEINKLEVRDAAGQLGGVYKDVNPPVFFTLGGSPENLMPLMGAINASRDAGLFTAATLQYVNVQRGICTLRCDNQAATQMGLPKDTLVLVSTDDKNQVTQIEFRQAGSPDRGKVIAFGGDGNPPRFEFIPHNLASHLNLVYRVQANAQNVSLTQATPQRTPSFAPFTDEQMQSIASSGTELIKGYLTVASPSGTLLPSAPMREPTTLSTNRSQGTAV